MKQFLSLIVLFTLCFSSCRDDVTLTNTIENGNNQEVFKEGDIVGIIIDAAGELVSGVDVSVEGESTVSDENGFFRFSQLAGSDDGSLIKFKHEGFFEGYKFVYTANNEDAYVQIKLIEKKETFKFQSSAGGTSQLNGDAKISIPGNSIVTDKGDAYNGEVVVFSHWYSPEEATTLETMPGDLRGIDGEGSTVQLATFGMMAVELESPGGDKLQLGNDQNAELTFPLSDAFKSNAPDVIPMWHFNEETGFWEEEGLANLIDNSYIGTVSHFSFWNCDASFPLVNIEGKLTDESGVAIPNYYVSIRWNGTYYGGYGITNSEGIFKGKVPRDAPLTLYVQHCGIVLLEEDLGFLSSDKDLGTYSITLTNFAKQVTATLLNCTNSPITEGYAIVRNGHRPELLVPDSDGNVSGTVAGCGFPEIIFTAHDPSTFTTSDEYLVSVDDNDQDLGDVLLCENLEDYVSFTINDGVENQIKEIHTRLVNDEFVHVFAHDESTDIRFDLQVLLTEIGTVQSGVYDIRGFNETGEFGYLFCRNSIEMCELTVEFTSNAELGMTLTGMASGEVSLDSLPEGGSSKIQNLDASFRVNVDETFNTGTIEGQAWVDVNENGIRESGEKPLKDAYIYAQRLDQELVRPYNENGAFVRTDEEGKYSISGLIPNVDYYLVFNPNIHYMPVMENQGGDDMLDSDFSNTQNFSYRSPTINLSDGEVVSHIDLGVSTPSIAINAYSRDCSPDAIVSFNIQGGVSPFSIELSNGDIVNDASDLFEGLTFGSYSLTVTDALGTTAENDVEIPEFRHNISGRVWLESSDGTPNVRDQFDEVYKNGSVELIEGSSVVGTVNIDQHGQYLFLNYPPGEYQVRPIVPAGFELVVGFVGGSWEQSGINADTGLSEVINAEGCTTNTSINIGLKE